MRARTRSVVHTGYSLLLTVPISQGIRMPFWKVLFIALLGLICMALALATLVVPMTIVEDSSRWLWLAGLLVSTILMGTMFRLYMNSADRAFLKSR